MEIEILQYVLSFGTAVVIAASVTPFVRDAALRLQVLDFSEERIGGRETVPRMGGIAIYAAFFMTAQLANSVSVALSHEPLFPDFSIYHLFLGATPLVLVGLIDDRYGLNYKWKLPAQTAVSILTYCLGYRIDGVTNPIDGGVVALGFLSAPVTIVWFIFIMNAINFIDGVDGLAAGVSLIALVTIFMISVHFENTQSAFLAGILAGSLVGFLRYNFCPASIYMGDTGSLLLGFLLAALSLQSAQKSSTAVAIVIPIVILGLPIMDVVTAVFRRWSSAWRSSRSMADRLFSLSSVFVGDRSHIHHRLLAQGLTKREVAVLLYLVSCGFGIAGFILTLARYKYIAMLLLYIGVVFFVAFRKFPALNIKPIVGDGNSQDIHSSSPSQLTLFQEKTAVHVTQHSFAHLLKRAFGILAALLAALVLIIAVS